MIKAKIKNPKGQPDRAYPCLKIASDGEVVLFTRPCTGMIVNIVNPVENRMGKVSSCWCEEDFTHFNGKVVLENK